MLIRILKRKNELFHLIAIISMVLGTTSAFGARIKEERRTGRTFIKLNAVKMNLRNRDDLNKTTELTRNTTLQFPDGVTVLDSKGNIDLKATISHWKLLSKTNKKYKAIGPKEGPGGHMYFPVKMIKSSSRTLNQKLKGRDSIGYVALDYLEKNINKSRYRMVYKTVKEVLEEKDDVTPPKVDSEDSGDGETTSGSGNKPPKVVVSDTNNHYNCNDTSYTSSRAKMRNNCLTRKGYSLRQKAELIMRDVLAINKLRPSFTPDPRFSVCIARRESDISPNAKGLAKEAGMYQIIWSTHKDIRTRYKAVVPGFRGKSANYERKKMIRSTLAQADIHHTVMLEKAKIVQNKRMAGAFRAASKGSSNAVYKWIADYYNASKTRKRYARKVISCYKCMKTYYDRKARKKRNFTGGQLKNCIDKAGH